MLFAVTTADKAIEKLITIGETVGNHYQTAANHLAKGCGTVDPPRVWSQLNKIASFKIHVHAANLYKAGIGWQKHTIFL